MVIQFRKLKLFMLCMKRIKMARKACFFFFFLKALIEPEILNLKGTLFQSNSQTTAGLLFPHIARRNNTLLSIPSSSTMMFIIESKDHLRCNRVQKHRITLARNKIASICPRTNEYNKRRKRSKQTQPKLHKHLYENSRHFLPL